MAILKVISGAQTGADRAGLDAAKRLGIATGGWMPHTWLAQDGCHPEFAELYDVREHKSDKYPPRTFANVRDAHATIRIARKFHTPGEVCTLKAITQYERPYWDFPLGHPAGVYRGNGDLVKIFFDALAEAHPDGFVLNVAGNSERSSPGIYDEALALLLELLAMYKGQ